MLKFSKICWNYDLLHKTPNKKVPYWKKKHTIFNIGSRDTQQFDVWGPPLEFRKLFHFPRVVENRGDDHFFALHFQTFNLSGKIFHFAMENFFRSGRGCSIFGRG